MRRMGDASRGLGLLALGIGLGLSGCEARSKAPGGSVQPAGSGVTSKAVDSEPVRIGIAIPSTVHAVAWIGVDKGHFEREGIDARVSVMGGSAATMRALIADRIDVGIAGGDAVVKANAAGADLVVIGGLMHRWFHRVIGRRGLTDPKALKGGKIGLPFLGGPQFMAVRTVMADWGYKEGDVEVLSLGKEFNRMAALERGAIDATTSQTPPGRLAKLGFRVLADLPASGKPFPYAVLVVRRERLTSKASELTRVLRALREATAFYRDHKDESLEVLEARLSGADTDGALAERYETAGPSLLEADLAIDRAAFEALRPLLPADTAKALNLDQLLDPSLLRAATAATAGQAE